MSVALKRFGSPALVVISVILAACTPSTLLTELQQQEREPSSSRTITSYTIVSPAAAGSITGTSIAVIVPFGTTVTELVASFATTGVSVKVGSTVQTSGVTTNDFTNPVVYTVTAADGTTLNYTVTVTVALQSSKAITAYSIVSPSANGTISGASIAMLVPHGTSKTALAAYFTTTGVSVKVGSTIQTSGVTTNDFTNPVVYTVTAADGTTLNYTVTVTVASFATSTTANGLGSNTVNRITVSGSTIYASTWGGLSISTNGGASWTNYTTTSGLGNNNVTDVAVSGSRIYASTGYSDLPGGVSISTNGGSSWTNSTSGLISNEVSDVAVSGSTVYAATWSGVSKSIDGGSTWTTILSGYAPMSVAVSGSTICCANNPYGVLVSNDGGSHWSWFTAANGLGGGTNSYVSNVVLSGSTIYAATGTGLSVSTNGGNNWTTYTAANGLGSSSVSGVAVSGSTICAATYGGGLSVSTNAGSSWTTYTTTSGLCSNYLNHVLISGTTFYVSGYYGGVSISQ